MNKLTNEWKVRDKLPYGRIPNNICRQTLIHKMKPSPHLLECRLELVIHFQRTGDGKTKIMTLQCRNLANTALTKWYYHILPAKMWREGYFTIIPLIVFPKTLNLSLIRRKHQINTNWGTSSKIPTSINTQNDQSHEKQD